LLESREKRGNYGLTETGIKLLSKNPIEVNVALLREYATYRDFVNLETKPTDTPVATALEDTDITPEEIMGVLSEQLNLQLAKSVPNSKIILIDGLTLAKFMIKHDLGVSTSNTIRIKKIDPDYFEEQ